MRQLFLRYPNRSRRIIEITIPLISWFLITMPLWLSFTHPALVAYIIILFDVYWFYKSVTIVYYSVRSYLTLTAHVLVDWLPMAKKLNGFDQLYHCIIIPQFHEPIHILERTLANLQHQDFPKQRIIIVLACEKKDPEAKNTSAILTEKYGSVFGHFLTTYHEMQIGEVTGKSSNMAHAVQKLKQYLHVNHIPLHFTTVTSCDADALPHPKYFSDLAYTFLSDPDRYKHFYQGSIMFYNNIWKIPLPNRFLNTLNSIWNLAVLSQKDRLINFSTYSCSLETALAVGGWAVDVIPEDYHMFFTVYFARGEHVATKPIFLPILVDAAESHGFFKTFVNQYEQAKRWAWGVSDIPYVIQETFIHKEIPLFDRLRRLAYLLEHHILWPTNWFLLTLGSTIPPLVNPAFARTVLGHNLAKISSGILTLSTVFLIIVFIIDWRIKPPPPASYPKWKIPFLYMQWITLPVISFFLSALPGLDAHTRMLLGKRLEYRVTEKI
jgi:cellulose synthase/poly-beta-1,6-N-acetylglucosamine synthase-like glycosyltransferase